MLLELEDKDLETAAGFNGDDFFTGVGILGGGLLAIAFAPEVIVGAAAVAAIGGSAAVGAAAGWFMGEGIAKYLSSLVQ